MVLTALKYEDEKDILLEMVDNAYDLKLLKEEQKDTIKTLINQGSTISNSLVLFFNVYANSLNNIYKEIYPTIPSMIDLDTATGEQLDILGKLLGLKRPTGTKCYTEILISLQEPQSEIKTIPKSVNYISTTDKIYESSKDIIIPAGNTEITAGVYSRNIGFNEIITAGTLTQTSVDLDQYTGTSTTVTNPNDATGGTYSANDEEYREYLKNAFVIHQKGTEQSFDYFFENLEGLDSYKLLPQWDGVGTLKIVIKPYTDSFVEDVVEKLEEVVLFEDGYTLAPPTEIPTDIFIEISVESNKFNQLNNEQKEEVLSRVKQSVETYFNGGFRFNNVYYKGLGIGEDFIPFQLEVFISQEVQEVQDISITRPEKRIKNGGVGLITLNSLEVNFM